MSFELVKDTPDHALVDKERDIVLKKKLGGRDYVVFRVQNGKCNYDIHVRKSTQANKTNWAIFKVDDLDGAEKGISEDTYKLLEEVIIEYKNLTYRDAAPLISISLELS